MEERTYRILGVNTASDEEIKRPTAGSPTESHPKKLYVTR